MKRSGLLGVGVAVGFLGACGDLVGPAPSRSLGDVSVSSGFLNGDIGYVQGINKPADDTVLQDYGDITEVDVMIDHQNGNSAMALLDVSGGLASLAGRVGTFTDNTVSVTGCAGPERGSWDYDEPADTTTYTIRNTPTAGLYRLDFNSHWDSSRWNNTPERNVAGHINFQVSGPGTSGATPALQQSAISVTSGIVTGTLNGTGVQGVPQSTRGVEADDHTRTVTMTFNADRHAAQLVFTIPTDINAMMVQGRTGIAVDSWDFDSPADTVSVRRSTENAVTWTHFTATWNNQTVAGSFILP